jgi:hypothetical protein|tara:strand:+ start:284 stop:547 length:264 start_codon:yes stop_codon:yes gene_type:complete
MAHKISFSRKLPVESQPAETNGPGAAVYKKYESENKIVKFSIQQLTDELDNIEIVFDSKTSADDFLSEMEEISGPGSYESEILREDV